MTKYYNEEIPDEIHACYGGRHSGKTYYEFNKIKEENIKLKEQNQFLCEEQRKIRRNSLNSYEWKSTEKEENKRLHRNIEILQDRILKAIEYITKNIELNNGALSNREELIVSKHDLIKNETDVLNCLKKILKGEE